MIETILNNLIENSLKYAGEKQDIVVYLSRQKNHIKFGVKDLGPGIQKELKFRIFQKFYRIGNEEVRTQKGSGLGLFIVSELVKMHHGEVMYMDNTPSGSNFQITLEDDK
jgi:K+-sensing histidine kinase KdpD